MLLADLFLEFLLPYKGAANFKTDKTQNCAYDFKSLSDRHLLERTLANDSTAIWHFLWHKCKMFSSSVLFFGRIHTTESFFDCTVPWWCSKYYASRRYLFFYAHKGFLKISRLGLKAIFKLNISFLTFPFSLFNFGAWFLNFLVEFEYDKIESVSFLNIAFIHISSHEQSSNRHVTLNC